MSALIELPRPLLPWASALAFFPKDFALAVGPMLGRLALAIGPLSAATQKKTGEPDGYDGVSRRGSYERLLTSEWLLAEELPDEFLRRASSGEQLFLRTARKEPAATRRCVALFDGGPSQLGAPRVAQLAALIVLAQRARSAGATFSWGLLQQETPSLIDDVNQVSVLRLLAGRSCDSVSLERIVAWHKLLSAMGSADEIWLIGDDALQQLSVLRNASYLLLRDILAPGARAVSVRVERRGRAGSEIRLELPEDRACARLLRDPFEAAPTYNMAAPDGRIIGEPMFMRDGRRLLAPLENGELLKLPVPNSPRAAPGRWDALKPPPGFSFIAAGSVGKHILAISRDDEADRLCITRYGPHGGLVHKPRYAHVEGILPPRMPGRIGWCGLWIHGSEVLAMIDVLGRIWKECAATKSWRSFETAQAFELGNATLVYVTSEPTASDPEQHIAEVRNTNMEPPLFKFPCPPSSRFYFGHSRSAQSALAVAVGNGVFKLQVFDRYNLWPDPKERVELHLAEDVRVVGTVASMQELGIKDSANGPGLVLIENDQRTISIVSRHSSAVVFQAPDTLEYVSLNSQGTSLSFVTTSGELFVISILNGKILLRREAGRAE